MGSVLWDRLVRLEKGAGPGGVWRVLEPRKPEIVYATIEDMPECLRDRAAVLLITPVGFVQACFGRHVRRNVVYAYFCGD